MVNGFHYRTSDYIMLGNIKGLLLAIFVFWNTNAAASCTIPEPDLSKASDTAPALVAYISKLDVHKGKVELKSKWRAWSRRAGKRLLSSGAIKALNRGPISPWLTSSFSMAFQPPKPCGKPVVVASVWPPFGKVSFGSEGLWISCKDRSEAAS